MVSTSASTDIRGMVDILNGKFAPGVCQFWPLTLRRARGGRQIVIDEAKLGDNEVDTWIRLEDGSVSGRITLNSTYGTDRYPIVAALKSSDL